MFGGVDTRHLIDELIDVDLLPAQPGSEHFHLIDDLVDRHRVEVVGELDEVRVLADGE